MEYSAGDNFAGTYLDPFASVSIHALSDYGDEADFEDDSTKGGEVTLNLIAETGDSIAAGGLIYPSGYAFPVTLDLHDYSIMTYLYWSDYCSLDLNSYSITPVPEPSTMLLLGSGLIGLVGYGRKRFLTK